MFDRDDGILMPAQQILHVHQFRYELLHGPTIKRTDKLEGIAQPLSVNADKVKVGVGGRISALPRLPYEIGEAARRTIVYLRGRAIG